MADLRVRRVGLHGWRLVAAIAATVVLAIVAYLVLSGRPGAAGETRPEATVDVAGALDALDGLTVGDRGSLSGYDRAAFGNGWLDPDGNGCDARNDVLARDLRDITVAENGCTVLSGVLEDPYTGTDVDFVRGQQTSAAVQIDHVVPLADAWRNGADRWTTERRQEFANDPANLLAVDGPTNSAKGAGNLAEWQPPDTGFRCEYAARQVSVKSSYALRVTEAEYEELRRVLLSCS